MSHGYWQTVYKDEEERRSSRILSVIIMALCGTYLFVIFAGIYFGDWKLIVVTLAGWAVLLLSLVSLSRGYLRVSSLIVVLSTLVMVTIIATVGQGIRDLAIVAVPIIFIFAGIALNRALFRLSVGLALAAACWLYFGEAYGLFEPKPLEGDAANLLLLILVLVLLLVAALAVDLLIANMRESLERARREISQRKQVEEEVKNSERRLQALIENGLDYISLLDLEGKLLWESPSSTSMLGYRFNEFYGRNIFEAMHPDDLEWTRRQFVEVAREPGNRRAGVFRLRRADGSWRWVEAIASNFLHDPAVGAIVVNYRDITERKHSEEALHLSESRYRQAITAAGAVPYYRDYQKETHAYTFMGEGILQLTGYSAVEITPAIFDQLEKACVMRGSLAHLTPDEAGLLSEAGKIRQWTCDYRILTRDGQTRWVSDSAIQIRDENNRRLGVIGILQDITERKQVEESEREQRALAEALRYTAAELNSTLKFHEVLDRILDCVGRVVPHDASNIMLLDKDGDTLSIVCNRGYPEHGAENIAAVQLSVASMPILVESASNGQPAIIPDTHADPDWLDIPASRWVCSYLTVPIRLRQRTIGFLNLDSAVPGFFNSGHAERLGAFADQVAIAVENAQLYEEVQKLAITDTLTGSFNRAFFEAELARLESSRDFPVSIIVADLDNLKTTNDEAGHSAGDELLKSVAQALRETFRAADIIARIGGDEFAVLLPATNAETADQMMARVKERLAKRNAEHPDLPVQLSLGAATAGKNNLTEAFKLADQRMYKDKAARKSKGE